MDVRQTGVPAMAIVFLVFLSSATAVAYATFDHHPELGVGASSDAVHYLAMLQGASGDEVAAPYRYRVLTPLLARAIPGSVLGAIPIQRAMDAESDARLRFAIVNMLGLASAAFFMFLLLRRLQYTDTESILGGMLLLALLPVAAWSTLPMTDALGYAFLTMCLWALAADRPGWLVVAFALGLLQKETILIVPLAALLMPSNKGKWMAVVAVPLVLYLGYRMYDATTSPQTPVPAWGWGDYVSRLFLGPERASFAFHSLMTFGVIWLLAALGWRAAATRPPLAQWRFLLIPILLAPFLLVRNVPRVWSYAFPLMIPLALLGLRRVLEVGRFTGKEQSFSRE